MKNILFRLKETYTRIFLYPIKHLSTERVDYDDYWKDKRGRDLGSLSLWQKKRSDLALMYMTSEGPISVIDVGCGDGSVLKYIKERTSLSSTVGVDVSKAALIKAKELGITTIHSNIEDLEKLKTLPKADYILLFEILEHIHNSEAFLEFILSKTRKGVFISFPNTGYFVHRFRLFFGKFPLQWRLHPGEHIRFWTYTDAKWWLKALGYDEYSLKAYKGIPFLNHLWPSLFGAGLFIYLPKK